MSVLLLLLIVVVVVLAPLGAAAFRVVMGVKGQGPPVLDHDRLRWTLLGFHLRRWTLAASLWGPLVGLIGVVWLAWATALYMMQATRTAAPIVGTPASAPPSWLDPWADAGWLPTLMGLPGVLVVIVVVAGVLAVLRLRGRRRTLEADADGLRVVAFRSVEHLRWSELEAVRSGSGTLELVLEDGARSLAAPGTRPEDLEQVVAWLDATRSRRPELPRDAPPPAELLRLREREPG